MIGFFNMKCQCFWGYEPKHFSAWLLQSTRPCVEKMHEKTRFFSISYLWFFFIDTSFDTQCANTTNCTRPIARDLVENSTSLSDLLLCFIVYRLGCTTFEVRTSKDLVVVEDLQLVNHVIRIHAYLQINLPGFLIGESVSISSIDCGVLLQFSVFGIFTSWSSDGFHQYF